MFLCYKTFSAKLLMFCLKGYADIDVNYSERCFITLNEQMFLCYKTFSTKLLMFCLKGYADSDVNYFEKSFITLNEVFDVIKLFPPNY